MTALLVSEREITAALRVPIPAYVAMVQRAEVGRLWQTAQALRELGQMVERSGIPQVPTTWQRS